MNEFGALRDVEIELAFESLAEALRCVDASDFIPIDGELSGSSSSAPSSEFQAHETQESLRSSYTNKREELRVLRTLARQLEARLAVLHGRRSRKPVPRTKQSSKATVKSHLWESMATRQFHALEKSESENARLKALVAEQHAQIQSLKRLVMKKQSKLLSSYRVDYPLWPYQMNNDPFTSPVMDMTMEHDLLGMLRGIDRIVADSRYPVDPRESFNVANLVPTDSECPTIEVLISRSFPFEHKAVAGALWDIWSMQPSHPNRRDCIHITNQRMRCIAHARIDVFGERIPFRAKFIGCRATEGDRTTLATSVLFQLLDEDGSPRNGVAVRLRTWNIFRSVPFNDQVGGGVTYRHFYALSTLLPLGANAASAHDILDFKQSLHHMLSGEVEICTQNMENQLLAMVYAHLVGDEQSDLSSQIPRNKRDQYPCRYPGGHLRASSCKVQAWKS